MLEGGVSTLETIGTKYPGEAKEGYFYPVPLALAIHLDTAPLLPFWTN